MGRIIGAVTLGPTAGPLGTPMGALRGGRVGRPACGPAIPRAKVAATPVVVVHGWAVTF